jgi:hypothetical protein
MAVGHHYAPARVDTYLRAGRTCCWVWYAGLVANPTVEGCNGGDSSHVLQFLRHTAAIVRSDNGGGMAAARRQQPLTQPWRQPAVILLNSGLWDIKTDPISGEVSAMLLLIDRY